MYDDGMPVTPLEDWRTFWEFPEEQTDGPTRQEFEADEAITAAEWPQLGEAWMLAFRYTAWDMHRSYSGGPDDERENVVLVMLDSPALRSHLEIELVESRLRFVVVSQDDLPVQALDVAVWRSLVTDTSKAARSPREFEWYAVIGAEPLGPLDPSDQRLVEAATIAGLGLTRLDLLDEESGIAALGTQRRLSFTPILVQGICRNWHDWGGDAEEEAIEVRRLCALLSVAWNGCWSVKLLPQNRGLDELNLKPPGEIEPPEDENLLAKPVNVSVEPWMSGAMHRLPQDQWLGNAVSTFHEGMLLYKDHPSFALLAFVASCDAIGHRIVRHAKPGQRVRAALNTVLTEAETAELWQAYAHRNYTAHEARLHGDELSYGLSRTTFLSSRNLGMQFTWGLLRSFRDATRDVLLRVLINP
jgi:hypothetical protein